MFDEDSRLTEFFSGITKHLREVLVGVIFGISIILAAMVLIEPMVIVSIINTILLVLIFLRLPKSETFRSGVEKTATRHGVNSVSGSGKHRGRPKGSKNKPKEVKA